MAAQLRPRRAAMPEIRPTADGRWFSFCPTCRRKWESARGETFAWVEFVAQYHRQLHRERRI